MSIPQKSDWTKSLWNFWYLCWDGPPETVIKTVIKRGYFYPNRQIGLFQFPDLGVWGRSEVGGVSRNPRFFRRWSRKTVAEMFPATRAIRHGLTCRFQRYWRGYSRRCAHVAEQLFPDRRRMATASRGVFGNRFARRSSTTKVAVCCFRSTAYFEMAADDTTACSTPDGKIWDSGLHPLLAIKVLTSVTEMNLQKHTTTPLATACRLWLFGVNPCLTPYKISSFVTDSCGTKNRRVALQTGFQGLDDLFFHTSGVAG